MLAQIGDRQRLQPRRSGAARRGEIAGVLRWVALFWHSFGGSISNWQVLGGQDVRGASIVNDQLPPSEAKDDEHYFSLKRSAMLLEFEIVSTLGHGGFGITYRATDTKLEETVAIKEYLPNTLAVRDSDSTVRPKSQGD